MGFHKSTHAEFFAVKKSQSRTLNSLNCFYEKYVKLPISGVAPA
jgi:hypothetical protein